MGKGNIKTLAIVGIIVLFVLSWYTMINDSVKMTNEYNNYLNTALEKAKY